MDSLVQDVKNKNYGALEGKLSVVERNVNRLNDLVVDLLTLSRLDEPEPAISEELNTEEITEEVIRDLKGLLHSKKQDIRTTYNVKSVRAHRIMLGQVLANLIENAVKYCDDGAVVEVIWDQTEAGTRLRVKDNGPGISEEHLSRVFERFYRVNNGRIKSTIGGTGLGLSIVKNSMLRMGGRAEWTVSWRGTTFTHPSQSFDIDAALAEN